MESDLIRPRLLSDSACAAVKEDSPVHYALAEQGSNYEAYRITSNRIFYATLEPLDLEKKGGNPDHHKPKNAINDRDLLCRAGVIEMSTNNE